jgi:hypothetical protein
MAGAGICLFTGAGIWVFFYMRARTASAGAVVARRVHWLKVVRSASVKASAGNVR